MPTKTYSVKEIAQLIGISEHAVRYYTDEGLVPTVQRDERGYRVFTAECLGWLQIIHCLRNCGMSLADIHEYEELCAQGDGTLEQRYAMMQRYAELAKEQLAQAQARAQLLENKLRWYEDQLAECHKH